MTAAERWHGPQERVHQGNVHHAKPRPRRAGGTRAGCGFLALNPPDRGSTSRSRWIVFASQAGRLREALGGAARGRAERHPDPLGPQDREDRVHQRGLAHAGPAGDHEELGARGEAQRFGLHRREGHPEALLDPGDRAIDVEGRPRDGAGGERAHAERRSGARRRGAPTGRSPASPRRCRQPPSRPRSRAGGACSTSGSGIPSSRAASRWRSPSGRPQ